MTETNSKLQENYVKLVKKTIEVCQDYELGIDIDDSIESLKEELQSQGISVTFDKEIMDVVNRLRSLQDKGIKVEKVLNYYKNKRWQLPSLIFIIPLITFILFFR